MESELSKADKALLEEFRSTGDVQSIAWSGGSNATVKPSSKTLKFAIQRKGHNGKTVTLTVTGPLGKPVQATYGLIGDSTAVIDAGMIRLSVMATTYFLCGLMEVGCGVMRGLGKSIPPMLVSLIGSCLFRVVWIFTVFAAFPTPIVLYISYPISWVLTALAHFIFCHRTYRAICQETVA